MKKLLQILKTRFTLSLLFVFGLAFSVHAQKEILLYSSDFTDWVSENHTVGTGSDDVWAVTSGAGKDFVIADKPIVNSTGSLDGDVGYYEITNGPNTGLTTKEFYFVCGGVVELLIATKTTSNSRFVYVTGADAVMLEAPVPLPEGSRYDRIGMGNGSNTALVTNMMGATTTTLDNSKVGVYYPGNSFLTCGGSAVYKVTYRLPPTFTGNKKIVITQHKDVVISSIKVYSGVCTTPYIASTNYPQYPEAGHVLTGAVAGTKYSGTPVNSKVNISSWNISADATLSIEGPDAAKFSFSNSSDLLTTTVPSAQLANPTIKTLDIYFTPSVKAGVANAKLKITAPGVANPYYVSLAGLTGGATPTIVTDTATIPFWTALIGTVAQSVDISGLNLSGPITLGLEGAGAERFSLSTNSISASEALSGANVDVSFIGDINVSTTSALLVLKSTGATTIKIPLAGYTSLTKPKLYNLQFEAVPAGTAYVTTSPASDKFLDGTPVKVFITPETGWKIDYWSDAAGNKRSSRTITVGELKNTDNGVTIKVYLIPGVCNSCSCDPALCSGGASNLTAYDATSITNNSFIAAWSSVTGASTYTVNVYDVNSNFITSYSTGSTAQLISGLSSGTVYKYSVTTSAVDAGTGATVNYDTGIVGGFKTTGLPASFTCGQ